MTPSDYTAVAALETDIEWDDTIRRRYQPLLPADGTPQTPTEDKFMDPPPQCTLRRAADGSSYTITTYPRVQLRNGVFGIRFSGECPPAPALVRLGIYLGKKAFAAHAGVIRWSVGVVNPFYGSDLQVFVAPAETRLKRE